MDRAGEVLYTREFQKDDLPWSQGNSWVKPGRETKTLFSKVSNQSTVSTDKQVIIYEGR